MYDIQVIIKVLDEEMLLLKKTFLSLSHANKILYSKGIFKEEDLKNKVLKQYLENNLISNSYQTKHEPKQWRICISEALISEEAQDESQDEEESIDDSKDIFCPFCGKSLYVPEEVINESELICPYCKSQFANPIKGFRPKQTIKKKEEVLIDQGSSIKLVIGLAVLIVCFIVWVRYKSGQNDPPGSNSSYSKDTYGNSSNMSSENTYYTNEGYSFAKSEDIFDRMMEYITNKDDRALNKLINADLVLLLPKNTEVFLLHTGITSTKVRLKGSTQELWTVSTAIHQ